MLYMYEYFSSLFPILFVNLKNGGISNEKNLIHTIFIYYTLNKGTVVSFV